MYSNLSLNSFVTSLSASLPGPSQHRKSPKKFKDSHVRDSLKSPLKTRTKVSPVKKIVGSNSAGQSPQKKSRHSTRITKTRNDRIDLTRLITEEYHNLLDGVEVGAEEVREKRNEKKAEAAHKNEASIKLQEVAANLPNIYNRGKHNNVVTIMGRKESEISKIILGGI